MKKARAHIYEEKNGAFALYCRSKKQAVKLLQEVIDEEINANRDETDEFDEEIVVREDAVKEDWAYPGHRNCDEGYSIGEAICYGCGEGNGGRAVKCYSFSI